MFFFSKALQPFWLQMKIKLNLKKWKGKIIDSTFVDMDSCDSMLEQN